MARERSTSTATSLVGADALLGLACRAGLAVAFVDQRAEVCLLSPGLQRLLNLHDEVVPVPALLQHLDDSTADGTRRLPSHERPLMRAWRGEVVEDAHLSLRPPGQPLRHLRVDAVPARGLGGEPRGAWALVTDVSRRVASERGELDRSLAETVDHDLRTPLTTVLGQAELLLDQVDDLPPAAARSVEAVSRAGHRLAEVVSRISGWIDVAFGSTAARQEGDHPRGPTSVRRSLD